MSDERLPQQIKGRLNAMKHLLLKTSKINEEFYKQVYQLELEYKKKHDEVFKERLKILSGEVEPTGDECKWESESESEKIEIVELSNDINEKVMINEDGDKVKGVPGFWLKVLQNVQSINDMIMPHDEPILAHLTNIHYEWLANETSFIIKFYFSPNEYFVNEYLTKTYFLTYDIPKETPFTYTGPEIIASQGCHINWNKGKNVTIKHIKKVQKHKNRGEKRTVTKTVDNDSFFNYFDSRKQSMDEEYDDYYLHFDFKLGDYIRDSIIPRAVLHYTGEETGSELDEDDSESDEDFDDDDEDADSKDELTPKKRDSRKGEGEPECKTQ